MWSFRSYPEILDNKMNLVLICYCFWLIAQNEFKKEFGRLVDIDKDGLASKNEIEVLMVSFPHIFGSRISEYI